MTSKGNRFLTYNEKVQSLATRFGIHDFPNCTTVRKAGATAASKWSSTEEMSLISQHMTHSAPTSERYYQNRYRVEVAKKVHKTIVDVTG